MLRSVIPGSLLVVLGVLGLAAVASCLLIFTGAGAPLAWGTSVDGVGASTLKTADDTKTRVLRDKLQQPIDLPDGFPANTSLRDALEFLSLKHGVQFIIDTNAFASIDVPKPEDANVQLPKLMGVSLSTVLRLMLGQVKGTKFTGAYRVTDEYIEITTTYHKDAAQNGVIDVSFDRRPLQMALRELADMTDTNITLDPSVADKARRPVTAALSHVTTETAVRILADMADLKLVILDNVLYVTTREKARELQGDEEKREDRRKQQPPAKMPVMEKE